MTSAGNLEQSNPVNEFARGWTVLLAAFVGIGVNLASMA